MLGQAGCLNGAAAHHSSNCSRGFCPGGGTSWPSGELLVIFHPPPLGIINQVEWMARLDFLWQLQARDEKLDMEALQGSNRYTE